MGSKRPRKTNARQSKKRSEKAGPKHDNQGAKITVRLGPNLTLTGPAQGVALSPTYHLEKSEQYIRDGIEETLNTERENAGTAGVQSAGAPIQTDRRRSRRREMKSTTSGPTNESSSHSGHWIHRERDKFTAAQKKILELEHALKEKDDDLKAALAFMNIAQAPALSGAEVIELAVNFNGDVFQAAAHISESFKPSTRTKPWSGIDERTWDELENVLGNEMLRRLVEGSARRSSNGFLLRSALQLYMTNFGEKVLRSWSSNANENQVLEVVYQKLLNQGE
ncbi:hypothetical protein H0H92_000452 [Tricholoma furcatifolium]|nr:hypothetical protein H0H92_000452 [Tricholoma furcatifolium]